MIALGGDGTALGALHAAAPVSCPVLGIACGSIGVLTSVHSGELDWALEQVAAGDWVRQRLPGLEVSVAGEEVAVAINDVAVVRNGAGQVIIAMKIDDELYARTAGDGLVAASPLGSTAYTMAAGGPIVLPQVPSIVLTLLAATGAFHPLVVGPDSRISLVIESGAAAASRWTASWSPTVPRRHPAPTGRVRHDGHTGRPGDAARRTATHGPDHRLAAGPGARQAHIRQCG